MKSFFLFLLISLVLALVLFIGIEPLSISNLIHDPNSLARALFVEVRVPRVLLGFLVGMGLSVAGVAFQALLKNPMADPFILGVSGGAALGSVFAVGFHLPFLGVSLVSFISALASMFLIYFLASQKGRLHPHNLLLVGVLFNSTTFALILFINSILSIEDLHRVWFMMVGSLETIEYSRLLILALLMGGGLFLLFREASTLNLLSLGEESARILGVDVEASRKRVFLAASLIVGACVSVSGLIGFVGLAVPHMTRLLFGADHRKVLPAAAFLGGTFLILADWVARVLFSGSQIQTQLPVGVVTALVGAPFFFYLLKKGRQ